MKKTVHFIGIDISSEYFTVSLLKKKNSEMFTFENFDSSESGFQSMLAEFQSKKVKAADSVICMEATGVYGESLAYFLASAGFAVAIENPYKIKKAFDVSPKKSDRMDSQKIAEYGFRFFDQLPFWTPKSEILEESRSSTFLISRRTS